MYQCQFSTRFSTLYGLTSTPRNGSISADGELELSGAESVDTDWWELNASSPLVSMAFADIIDPELGLLYVEAELTGFDFTDTEEGRRCWANLLLMIDDLNFMGAGAGPENDIERPDWFIKGKTNLAGVGSDWPTLSTSPDPNVTPQRYRFYWNPTSRSIADPWNPAMTFAPNGGAVYQYPSQWPIVPPGVPPYILYTSWHAGLPFVPTHFGISSGNGWGYQAAHATRWSYLSVWQDGFPEGTSRRLNWHRTVLDTRIANGAGNRSGGDFHTGVNRFVWMNNAAHFEAYEFNGVLWTKRETSPVPWNYSALAVNNREDDCLYLLTFYYSFWRRNPDRTWTDLGGAGVPPIIGDQDSWEMCVDTARNQIVVLANSGGVLRTFTFDVSGGSWINHGASGITSPVLAADWRMAFDPVIQKVVLYGGWQGFAPPYASSRIFTWDGSTWTQETPVGVEQPDARYGCGFCFDELRNGIVMYGGGRWEVVGDSFRIFGGTWLLSDGCVWSKLHEGDEPVFIDVGGEGGEVAKYVYSNTLHWDASRGRLAIFGGESANDRFAGLPVDSFSYSRVIEYLADPPGPWPCPTCGPGGVVE